VSERLTFHLIPHTHWDREWYLPRAAFLARLVGVVEDLIDQLDREPSARFVLDGQTVLLEDVLQVRPDLRPRLTELVRRGALEIGPWYILADELIPGGESLLRNLLEGSCAAAGFGGGMPVLYSPDAFGHPAVLPSLAREFGIRFGVAWRGVGRAGRQDRDLHRWIGPDGSVMLLYHLPRDGYSVGAGLATAGRDLAHQWKAIRRQLTERAVTGQVAVFVGADHHAAGPDLAGLAEQLQAQEPEHEVRISGLGEYFEALSGVFERQLELELGAAVALSGELRRADQHTWVLQGVHGTRSRLKRLHSTAELLLLRLAEPLAALAAIVGGRDQRHLVGTAWRTLLQAQFHDTLGGCCSDLVAREQEVRLNGLNALAREVALRGLSHLAGHDADRAREAPGQTSPSLVLWNPCARPRQGIVTAELTWFRSDVLVGPPGDRRARNGPGFQPGVLVSSTGKRIPFQVLGVRPGYDRLDADHHYPDQDRVDRVFVAFQAPEVDGLSVERMELRPGSAAPAAAGLEVAPDRMANPFVVLRISSVGEMVLEDRSTGERYPGLGLLEDEPDAGDTYTFSSGRGRVARGGRALSQSVVAPGPLLGAVEVRWTMASAGGGDLSLRLLVTLRADSPIVGLRFDIDNGAAGHRLRARFPVGAGEEAVAGAAFGIERRTPAAPAADCPLERPVSTAPAHSFVAAAEDTRGLAILAPGFFEYEWTVDRDVVVTLLRAVGELSRGDLAERPGHAGWPEPTPLAQEPGTHTIALAVAPIQEIELFRPDQLARTWEDAFLPVQAVFFRQFARADDAAPALPPISLEGDGLVFSALKPAENGSGWVLRCYNTLAVETEGRWALARPIRRALLLRADETPLEDIPLGADGTSVGFRAGPAQIVTLGIEFG
jgi:alpha-mannosidase